MLALPGGAYVYQGEELGLPEVARPARRAAPGPDLRARPSGERVGRATAAGCRSRGRATRRRSASARAAQPWLPQPADWAALTVEAQQADPASTLALYRAALRCAATARRSATAR